MYIPYFNRISYLHFVFAHDAQDHFRTCQRKLHRTRTSPLNILSLTFGACMHIIKYIPCLGLSFRLISLNLLVGVMQM